MLKSETEFGFCGKFNFDKFFLHFNNVKYAIKVTLRNILNLTRNAEY